VIRTAILAGLTLFGGAFSALALLSYVPSPMREMNLGSKFTHLVVGGGWIVRIEEGCGAGCVLALGRGMLTVLLPEISTVRSGSKSADVNLGFLSWERSGQYTKWSIRLPMLALVCLVYPAVCFSRRFSRWRRWRHRNPELCRCCGYSLRGNVSGVCPECGCVTKLGIGESHDGTAT